MEISQGVPVSLLESLEEPIPLTGFSLVSVHLVRVISPDVG